MAANPKQRTGQTSPTKPEIYPSTLIVARTRAGASESYPILRYPVRVLAIPSVILEGISMARKPDTSQEGQMDGEHAAPRTNPTGETNVTHPAQNTTTPPKRGPGRPKGSKSGPRSKGAKDLEKVDKAAKEQAAILKRQRKDCQNLSRVIIEAAGRTTDPKDAAALARSLVQLHAMEREAYDIGSQGNQIKAVIFMPARAINMDEWQAGASVGIPAAGTEDAGADPYLVEDDVQGEVDE